MDHYGVCSQLYMLSQHHSCLPSKNANIHTPSLFVTCAQSANSFRYQDKSALAEMAPQTSDPSFDQYLSPSQFYTAPLLSPIDQHDTPIQPYPSSFLACLSTFILHAPNATLDTTLRSSSTFSGKIEHINPNSDALHLTQFMTAMCQRLLRALNNVALVHAPSDHPSFDTIPLALCLLFRYRMASASTFQRKDAKKYEYAIAGAYELFSAPITYHDVTKCYRPRISDATLVAIAVHTAYKFLAEDIVNLKRWALPLELTRHSLLEGERTFLRVIDYAVWVRQEDYLQTKGKLDDLWEEAFMKAARPPPRDFVTKMLRTKG